MTFRPRRITSKVGVRPIIEGRPILGNLRVYIHIEIFEYVQKSLSLENAPL